MVAALSCSACAAEFPPEIVGAEDSFCPNCGRAVKVVVFPALLSGAGIGDFGERAFVDGESTCFYHPEKKAGAICDGCGRFLCGLCDITLDGGHICSGCLEAGRGGAGKKVETERALYEQQALALAVLSLLVGPFGVVPAVFAIYLSLRYWKRPEKLGTWKKVRKVAALVLSFAVLISWASLLVWVVF